MSGNFSALRASIVALVLILLPALAAADEPKPAEGSADNTAKPVLTQSEIRDLLADIHPRDEKGSVLIVECGGAYGYATIQSAIDAANDGDVIVVLPNTCNAEGRYYENINFLGKAITLQSAQPTNPEVVAATIIDGNADGTVVTFKKGESSETVLNGLTITNGYATGWAGGVSCADSSPTILNCRITENRAVLGSAIIVARGSPTFRHCEISGNHTSSASRMAGIVLCSDCNAIFHDCSITNNLSLGGGGLTCINNSSSGFYNCRITDNLASRGGGLSCQSSQPTLANCIIARNSAISSTLGGGGVFCSDGSTPFIVHCTIADNSSTTCGGAIHASASNPLLFNCILWNNQPTEVFSDNSLVDVLFSNIQNGWSGQGNINRDPLFAFEDDYQLTTGSPCIDTGTNSSPGDAPSDDITGTYRPLDGNADTIATVDMGAYEFDPLTPAIGASPFVVRFSLNEGESEETQQHLHIRNAGGGALTWSLSLDAAWLSADVTQGDSSGEIDTVTLTADASNLTHGVYQTSLTITDTQQPQTNRTIQVELYINDTLNVPTDFETIQEAIDAALPQGDEIVLADGTYTGSGNKNLNFGGKAISLRSQSGDPALCIIDCEDDGRGFALVTSEPQGTSIEGLTVQNGSYSHGSGVYCSGLANVAVRGCVFTEHRGTCISCDSQGKLELTGCRIIGHAERNSLGVSCSYAYLAMTDCTVSGFDDCGVKCTSTSFASFDNCIISDNTATRGGGVYCSNVAKVSFKDCTISGNSSSYEGGGLYCLDSNLSLTDCNLTNNLAVDDNGGAIYSKDCNVALGRCEINNNRAASDNGGGLYAYSPSGRVALADCNFQENEAEHGGGLYCVCQTTTITSSTFKSNAVSATGGGVRVGTGNVLIRDCVLNANTANHAGGIDLGLTTIATITACDISDNTATHNGGGVYSTSTASPTLNACTISGNDATLGGGVYCSGSSPTFDSCEIVDNDAHQYGGGLYISAASPALTKCIISRNFAIYDGGAVYSTGADTQPEFKNCLIGANTTNRSGGGVFSTDSSRPTLTNCSLTANTTAHNMSGAGGAVCCSDADMALTDCVIWSNQPDQISIEGSGTPTFSYSNIQGGWPGTGNLDTDPLFVDPDGADDVPGTEDDDFRLLSNSPCIDAGDPDFVAEPGQTDLDGMPRVMGCGVDIGAYEFVTGSPGSGDLNGDGDFGDADVALFVEALLSGAGSAATCVADLNADELLDGRDIQLFTARLLSGE